MRIAFLCSKNYGEATVQRPKKSELSGWQLSMRKNFPDEARKLRQFSNLRQMRIKGGFARFWIIQLHFLDDLDTF